MSTVPMKTVRRPFLTARWSNLAIVTWEVPPALLEPHLPAGLELDRRGGATLASLVAFDFLDTRVLGVPWLARAIYNEPYLVAPIESAVSGEAAAFVTARRLHWHGRTHTIEVTGS